MLVSISRTSTLDMPLDNYKNKRIPKKEHAIEQYHWQNHINMVLSMSKYKRQSTAFYNLAFWPTSSWRSNSHPMDIKTLHKYLVSGAISAKQLHSHMLLKILVSNFFTNLMLTISSHAFKNNTTLLSIVLVALLQNQTFYAHTLGTPMSEYIIKMQQKFHHKKLK